jgi:hypothetical protein
MELQFPGAFDDLKDKIKTPKIAELRKSPLLFGLDLKDSDINNSQSAKFCSTVNSRYNFALGVVAGTDPLRKQVLDPSYTDSLSNPTHPKP